MTQITRENGTSGDRWVAAVDGHNAEVTCSRLGTYKQVTDHTGIPDALRGPGVRALLAERMIA